MSFGGAAFALSMQFSSTHLKIFEKRAPVHLTNIEYLIKPVFPPNPPVATSPVQIK
jgi:hypothetical protein